MKVGQRGLLINLAVAIAYFVSGQLSLAFTAAEQYTSVAFLPAGIAIMVVLTFGWRSALPGLFFGSLLLNTGIAWDAAGLERLDLQIALVVATASSIQALLASVLIRRFCQAPLELETDNQILQFLMLVPLLTLISASISVPFLLFAGVENSLTPAGLWASWWLGDALGLLIAGPITLSFIGQPKALWRPRRNMLGLPTAVVFIAVVMVSQSVARFEQRQLEDRFRIRTQEAGTLFQIALTSQQLVQDSVAQLFVSSDDVSREEFRVFVKWATGKSENIQVIEWLPKVIREQRAAYEAEQQQYFGPQFTITDIKPGNKLLPAEDRDEYFPITYLEPEEGNQRAQGFDPTSSVISNAAVQTALASGSSYARPPLMMVRKTYSKRILMLYRPVYRNVAGQLTLDMSNAEVAGLVNVAIRTEDFVENVLGKREFTEFEIQWQDLLSGDYYYDVAVTETPPFRHRVDIEAAGRQMRLIFTPTSLFLENNQRNQTLFVMIGGFLLMSLFCALILSITGRTHRIASEVTRRTEQLSVATDRAVESERRIREVLAEMQRAQADLRLSDVAFNAASEGFLITDAEKNVIAINSAYSQITGFSQCEVLGQFPQLLDRGLNDELFFAKLWAELSSNGLWRGEMLSRRKDGEIFSTYLSMSLVRDDAGELSNYVAVFTDISESKQAQLTIEHQANYDLLTSLPNRRLFNDRLVQEIRHCQRDQSKLCLMFLDLDRFKDINDTLGHDVGDELLRHMAGRIQDCLRDVDTVARLGGDEFTIILTGLEQRQDAVTIAQKLIEIVEQPLCIKDQTIRISTSIGLTFYPDDGENAGLLMQNADRAMYAAKDAGGSAFMLYSSELESTWQSRTFIINELEQALNENQICIYYQPLIHAETGAISAEALVRWQHPERGLITPAEFLPAAERMGLIARIDDHVFAGVCQQILLWQQQGYGDIAVSVNRSAQGFGTQEGRLDWIGHLQQLDLDSSLITLEITEGVLLQRSAESRDLLRNLRNFGVKISIDDFGTGYSSLAYLKQLEVDYLKIDKSFVRDLETDDNDRAIIEAIVGMAKRLDINIVAEGVETASQRATLTHMGCDWLQGYYFAKPLAPEAFVHFLIDNRNKF
ncbi:MAG: EAL domain-containing protein [Methylophaga sp.]|nr:EAL domain-containing protein [Methylophaga sp.]